MRRGAYAGGRQYLIVVPVVFHRVGAGRIAADRAFCEHLRLLRQRLAPHFTKIVLLAPTMGSDEYERDRSMLGEIDETADGISLIESHPYAASVPAFWLRHFVPNLIKIARAVRESTCVHSSTSQEVKRPFTIFALLFAFAMRRHSLCVEDIDGRRDAQMNLATGRWSRKSYLLARYVYNPLWRAQLRIAVRICSLVLLKGAGFARDFGRGRRNVKDFYDTAFSRDQLIPEAALQRKLGELNDPDAPLEVVYFGRLTEYKGVDRCIEAVVAAARDSGRPIHFHVIGAGEDEARLRDCVERLGAQELVTLHGAVAFGPLLFERLQSCHLLLAAPLTEDTPRSAFDAMASGVPILAFDTAYYADLARSGAVETVAWPSTQALADRLAAYARDKSLLMDPARAAVAFATDNTAEIWVDRRLRWTLDLFGLEPLVSVDVREVVAVDEVPAPISVEGPSEPAARGSLR